MAFDGGTAVVRGTVDGSAVSRQLATSVNKAGTSSAVRSSVMSAGKTLGVTLGVAFAVGFAKRSIDAAEEAEKVNGLFMRNLKQLGAVGVAAFNPVVEWADKLQYKIGQDDEAIKTVASRLVQMGSQFFAALGPKAAKALEKITSGLINMSVATGKSVGMLMRSLGPAILNTPTKAIPLLIKYGAITDQVAEKAQRLAAAGDKVAASQTLVNAIVQRYGSAAASAATPSEKLAVTMDELQESVGKNLVPLINLLAKGLKVVLDHMKLVTSAVIAFIAAWVAGKVLTALPGLLLNIALGAEAIGAKSVATGILASAAAMETLAAAAQAAMFGIGLLAFAIANSHFGEALDAAITPAINNVGQLAQAQKLAAATGMPFADALEKVRTAAGGAGKPVADLNALLDQTTTHVNKAGEQVKNFAGLTKKGFREFKSSVVESVQVAIGQFEHVGDAFKTTPRELLKASRDAITIAKRMQRDLKVIFADKTLTEGQKKALAQLPADQRDAWVRSGDAARKQIAKNAVTLANLNRNTFNEIKSKVQPVAESGGKGNGNDYVQGLVNSLNEGKGPAATAALALAHTIITSTRAGLDEGSPSKEAAKSGKWYVEGLVMGMQSQLRQLARSAGRVVDIMVNAVSGAKSKLKDAIDKGVGESAARAVLELRRLQLESARHWDKMVSQAQRAFDRIKDKLHAFQSAIRGGFSDLKDLGGALTQQWQEYLRALDDFNARKAAGTLNPGEMAPNAPNTSATIGKMVADAQALAKALTDAAAAGLSKGLLAQFASQGADAIPALNELLANPALIAQLNQAGQTIATAAGQTADTLGDKFFGRALTHASNRVDHLTEALERFIRRLARLLGDTPEGNALRGLQGSTAPTMPDVPGLAHTWETPPILPREFRLFIDGKEVAAVLDERLSERRRTMGGRLALDARG